MSTQSFAALYAQAEAAGSIRGILDVGNYDVEIAKVTTRETNKGGTQINLQVRVLAGPHQGKTDFISQTVPTAASKEGAIGAFFGFLQRVGVSPQELDAYGIEPAFAKAVGQRWNVDVTHREYNGNTYSDVKLKRRLEAGAPAPAPAPAPPQPEPAPEHGLQTGFEHTPAGPPPAVQPEPAPAAVAPQEAVPAPAPTPVQAPGARPW